MSYSVTRLQNGTTVLQSGVNPDSQTIFPSTPPNLTSMVPNYTPEQMRYVNKQLNLFGVDKSQVESSEYTTIIPPIVDINEFVEVCKTLSRHRKPDNFTLGDPVKEVINGVTNIVGIYKNNAGELQGGWIHVPSNAPNWRINECMQLVYHGPKTSSAQLVMPNIKHCTINVNGQIVYNPLAQHTIVPNFPPAIEQPPYRQTPIEANSRPIVQPPIQARASEENTISVQATPVYSTPVNNSGRAAENNSTPNTTSIGHTQVVAPSADRDNGNNRFQSRRQPDVVSYDSQGNIGSNTWKWVLGILGGIVIASTLGFIVSNINSNRDTIQQQQQQTQIKSQDDTNLRQEKTIESLKASVEDLKVKNTEITALNSEIERLNQDIRDIRNSEKKVDSDSSIRIIQERTALERQVQDLKDAVSKQADNASSIQQELAKVQLPNQADFDKLRDDLASQTDKIKASFEDTQTQMTKLDSGLKKLSAQAEVFKQEWNKAKPQIDEIGKKADEIGKKVDQTFKSIVDFVAPEPNTEKKN